MYLVKIDDEKEVENKERQMIIIKKERIGCLDLDRK